MSVLAHPEPGLDTDTARGENVKASNDTLIKQKSAMNLDDLTIIETIIKTLARPESLKNPANPNIVSSLTTTPKMSGLAPPEESFVQKTPKVDHTSIPNSSDISKIIGTVLSTLAKPENLKNSSSIQSFPSSTTTPKISDLFHPEQSSNTKMPKGESTILPDGLHITTNSPSSSEAFNIIGTTVNTLAKPETLKNSSSIQSFPSSTIAQKRSDLTQPEQSFDTKTTKGKNATLPDSLHISTNSQSSSDFSNIIGTIINTLVKPKTLKNSSNRQSFPSSTTLSTISDLNHLKPSFNEKTIKDKNFNISSGSFLTPNSANQHNVSTIDGTIVTNLAKLEALKNSGDTQSLAELVGHILSQLENRAQCYKTFMSVFYKLS
jgi:hypothetical protein